MLISVIPAQTQTVAGNWFPAQAVSCDISSQAINLGILDRLDNLKHNQPLNVSCQSTAYPSGYNPAWHTAYAGFCFIIEGEQNQRRLTGQEDGNKGYSIPFNFYFGDKKFENPDYQDYGDAIGNGGDWGISYIDWNYTSGSNSCPINTPSMCGSPVNVGKTSPIAVQLDPSALPQTMPSGLYSGDFTFRYRYGAATQAEYWPKPKSVSNVCSQFPGGTKTGSFHVQLTIKKYCSVSVDKPIDFGMQTFLSKGLTAKGGINVQCTLGTKYGISMGKGYHSDGSGQRYMALNNANDTDAKIPYNIYQDDGMTKPWGDFDDGNKNIVTGIGAAANASIPVFAQVPPLSGLKPAGKYQDTVVVTVKILDPGTAN